MERGKKRTRGRQIPVREDEGHSTSDTSGKVLQDLGRRAYFIGRELKYEGRFMIATGPISATPSFTAIGNVVRGDGPSQRIGNKIVLTALEMTYVLEIYSSYPFDNNMNASETVRFLVVVDHQNNLASPAPSIDDILWDAGTGSSPLTRHYNPKNRDRFSILHDELETFNYPGVGGTSAGVLQNNHAFPRKIKLELPDILVTYDSTGNGSYLAVQDNQMYVYVFSRYGYPAMTFSEYMLRYYDV